MKLHSLRFAGPAISVVLFVPGIIAVVAPAVSAPQDEPPSDQSTHVPKVTTPTDLITLAAPSSRQNCGTFWTGLIDDPDADVNPCPKGCGRGEQQVVNTHVDGDSTRYEVRYQCYEPETPKLMMPPDAPSSGENCGTFWTDWMDTLDADANPCPEKCVRGQEPLVKTARSSDGIVYAVRYQCFQAEALRSVFGDRRDEIASQPLDINAVSQPAPHSFDLAGFTASGTPIAIPTHSFALAGFTASGSSLPIPSHSFELAGFTASGTSIAIPTHSFELAGFTARGTAQAIPSHSFDLAGWTAVGSTNKPVRRKR